MIGWRHRAPRRAGNASIGEAMGGLRALTGYHPSRFARQYQERFGELPSDTARRKDTA